MNIIEIEKDPTNSLIYLDRYVNDGSPSGFTEKYRTSESTDPFSIKKSFHLYALEEDEKYFSTFGNQIKNIPLKNNQLFVHPDMKKHPSLKGFNLKKNNEFSVSPTSSCRTVRILSADCNDYVKLHYDGIIGRVNRKLNTYRAISGVEISNILKKGIDNDCLSGYISIYEEPFARLFLNPNEKNKNSYWGMVWRLNKPYGKNSKKIKYTIPLFSLWSKDRLDKHSKIIGEQLFDIWGHKSNEIYSDKIIFPIIDTYFEFLIKLGLQNELNSQNILIGFDEKWIPISIIIRDLMGIEKDIDIRNILGLSNNFTSNQYKLLSSYNNNYQIRHSFAFDFKVSHYVIKPLVNFATKHKILEKDKIISQLKSRVKYWINLLPKDFFPEKYWYSHENVLLTHNRKYVKNTNPLLRD